MKNRIAVMLLAMVLMPVGLSAADKEADDNVLVTDKDKISYIMGIDLGKYLGNLRDKIDLDKLKIGIDDGFAGAEPKLTEEEVAQVQQTFTAMMEAEKEAQMTEMKTKNKAAGEAYLAENKDKDGVMVTESGLQYEVLQEGDGATPKATDTVTVDYVGTLVNGQEFDSSVKRGEPAVFMVNQVIPGWSEALQLMQVGSKYKVAIPSELAYGEAGAPPVIEPNSVLVFEIDLLSIEPEVEAEASPETPAEQN